MRINRTMAELLAKHGVDFESIAPLYHFPIWQKTDKTGRPYWGTGNFCSMDRYGGLEERNLSQLEWDGNELGYHTDSEGRLPNVLADTIGVLKAWQITLEKDYSQTEFCVLASYDDGRAMWEEDEVHDYEILSTTFRFWATRGNDDVVNLEHFDDWEQPAILIVCNQIPPQ